MHFIRTSEHIRKAKLGPCKCQLFVLHRGHSYFPSPEDWRALSIYQLVTAGSPTPWTGVFSRTVMLTGIRGGSDTVSDSECFAARNNEAFEEGFDVRDMTFRPRADRET